MTTYIIIGSVVFLAFIIILMQIRKIKQRKAEEKYAQLMKKKLERKHDDFHIPLHELLKSDAPKGGSDKAMEVRPYIPPQFRR